MPWSPTSILLPPKICVGTASGQIQRFSASGRVGITTNPEEDNHGHVMTRLPHMLIVIGKLCNADCNVIFNKNIVSVLNPAGDTILNGWRDKTSPWIWSLHLRSNTSTNTSQQASSTSAANHQQLFIKSDRSVALSDYDLPSVKDFVCYLHAAAGFPKK